MENENLILFDWLTVSSKNTDPDFFIGLLSLKGADFQPTEKGMNGYKQRLFWENISVLYDGSEGMGTCLNLSGQGCRAFETYSNRTFQDLFEIILTNSDDFKITRLDVAFDDHTGILDIDQLFYDCNDREFVSKMRSVKIEKSFQTDKPEVGLSIYHGSNKSAILFRIYDKAVERGRVGEHWIRVEMQLRDDRALEFLKLAEPIGERFRGVLYNYLRYVDDNGDSNRWRWDMKPYWAALLENVERIKLYTPCDVEYNISHLDNFVFGISGNAIDAAIKIHGRVEFLNRIKNRTVSANPKYEKLVEDYMPKRKEVEYESKSEMCAAIGFGEPLYRTVSRRELFTKA